MNKIKKAIKKLAKGEFKELGDRAREKLIRRQEKQHYQKENDLFASANWDMIFKEDFISTYRKDQNNIDFISALQRFSTQPLFTGFKNQKNFKEQLVKTNPIEFQRIIDSANKIVSGKYPIFNLGYISYGEQTEFNHDPINKRQAPESFYGDIDYLNFEQVGDSKVIWELSRFQFVYDLGQAYLLTADETYPRTFFNLINEWNMQNPDYQGINYCSALEFAFRIHSLLWGLHFFINSENFTNENAKSIYRLLYISAYFLENHLSTYFSPNTHLSGEALGLFIIAQAFPEFQKSEQWDKIGYGILENELDQQITSNGFHTELSTAYHAYTLEFYLTALIIAESCQRKLSGKFAKKLSQMTYALKNILRPDGTSPHIGDEDGGRLYFLSRLPAGNYQPILEAAENYLAGKGKSNRAFYNESFWLIGSELISESKKSASALKSISFPDAGFFISRSSEKKMFSILQGGQFGYGDSPHSHADMLHLDISVDKDNFIIDPGTFIYTGSVSKRNQYRSLVMHNAPTIDKLQLLASDDPFSWQQMPDCQLECSIETDNCDFRQLKFQVRLANKETAIINRSVLFVFDSFWIVCDQVVTSSPQKVNWNFITPFKARITDQYVTILGEKSKLAFIPILDKKERKNFAVSDCHYSDDYLSEKTGYKLQLSSPEGKDQQALFLLVPFQDEIDRPEQFDKLDLGDDIYFKFTSGVENHYLIKGKARLRSVENIYSDAELIYLGERSGKLFKMLMINGSIIKTNGETIYKTDKPLEYVELIREDGKEVINTSDR